MKSIEKRWLLGGVMLAMLLSSLDQTIVSTAMPDVVKDLQGIEHLSWVFTAYMLGSTVTVPVYGKLSDIFGRRNLYLLGIGIFLAGSVLCGLSSSMNQLIIFRALQGIGGGAMMVNSFAIIGDVFPPAERAKYQGLIGGVFGLSSVAGPLLGGWITDNFSWRWVFYVNIPLGIITIIVLSAVLPKIVKKAIRPRIDFAGAFFIVTTLVPLLLSLVWGGSVYPWKSFTIISLLLTSVISMIIFILIERRVSNPILSLSLFRNRVFITAVSALFFTAMGMFGSIIYIPLFAQGVIGVSATKSGLILAPMMLTLVAASTISGQVISRTGKYKALAVGGTIVTIIAMFSFSWLSTDTTRPELIGHMMLLGLGLGSTMPIFTLAIQNAFTRDRLGEVTAGSQLFRSIGGTVGTAILGGIMNTRLAMSLDKLRDDPFVVQWQRMNPGPLKASLIESVISPGFHDQAMTAIAKLPIDQQSTATQTLNNFVATSKNVFTGAVDNLFFMSAVLMCVALIAVMFLPQVALRRTNQPVMEDVGIKLEDEFGHADKDDIQIEEGARTSKAGDSH
jgi:EmrB/QacA subfamily drug resistance transporter